MSNNSRIIEQQQQQQQHSHQTMVRKCNEDAPESPTLRCSSSSEDELKCDSRLGRVLQEEEDNNAEEQEATTKRFSQEELLLRAMETLTRLAVLDSSQYQTRLRENSLPAIEDPALFSKLQESIHRFHSMVTNLTRENDQQTCEIIDLRNQVDTSQARIAKLEKAVTKLHRRNLKLKTKSRSDKSIARTLMEQVKTFTNKAEQRKQDEEFYRLADKVQQHEQYLRDRSDSNFSGLDGLQDFDNKSVESSASGQSLVTDDGVATLRIEQPRTTTESQRERTFTWPNANISHQKNPTITDTHNESPLKNNGTSNPFAMMFLAPKVAQPYTLSFLHLFSLQFVSLQVNSEPSTTSSTTNNDTSGGMTPLLVTETAFAVCGYQGFDFNANVKPTLGARLLRINEESVTSSWSAEDLEKTIRALGGKASMTFRNDCWDKKQKEALNSAHRKLHPKQGIEISVESFLRKRTQSGDSIGKQPNQLLDFLNFNHHSPKGQTSKEHCDAEEQLENLIKTPPNHSNKEESATKGQTTKDSPRSPMNNPMLSFWKKNHHYIPDEECVSFDEQDDSGELSFPDEEIIKSGEGDLLMKNDEGGDNEKVATVPESKQGGTEEDLSKTKGAGGDKFKSSMKSMGKLFAFR